MKTFFTKLEIARMLIYQYPLTESEDKKLIDKLVNDITNYNETDFINEVLKAGISCSNFGYNRYYIN